MNSQLKENTTKDLSIYSDLGIKTRTNNFIRWSNNGLFENIDEDFIDETQEYWMRHYNKKIDPYLHIAFMNLTGTQDKRLIPQTIMRRNTSCF